MCRDLNKGLDGDRRTTQDGGKAQRSQGDTSLGNSYSLEAVVIAKNGDGGRQNFEGQGKKSPSHPEHNRNDQRSFSSRKVMGRNSSFYIWESEDMESY